MRKGVQMEFYFPEGARHHHHLLHEWLLQAARDCGIKRGSVFRAIARFGRHRHMHYGHLLEDAGKLPDAVRLLPPPELAGRRIATLRAERGQVFFGRSEVEFGWTPDDDSA